MESRSSMTAYLLSRASVMETYVLLKYTIQAAVRWVVELKTSTDALVPKESHDAPTASIHCLNR